MSPALCALLLKPHGQSHGKAAYLLAPVHAAFRLFDIAFDAMARGYGRLVRTLARAWVPVLIAYVLLVAFGGWFLQHQPTGFIPTLDRAIVIISLQLPPGAALARTDAVVRRATDLVLSTPGVKFSNAFTGRNAATFTAATNAALLFLVLDDFEERHKKGQSIDKVTSEVRAKLGQIEEAQSLVFIPPPVRGMGAAAGFSMRLQDTMGLPSNEFAQITQEFVAAANRTPGIANAFTTFQTGNPAGVRRRRPRQGADAEGARQQDLRGHARVHGLGLRQRLQHVRPHLPRHRPGRRRLPPRPGERRRNPSAQRRRANGAARQPRRPSRRSPDRNACRAIICSPPRR